MKSVTVWLTGLLTEEVKGIAVRMDLNGHSFVKVIGISKLAMHRWKRLTLLYGNWQAG